MKKLLLALLAASVVGVAVTPTPNGNVSLAWTYPSSELSTGLTFQVRGSPTLATPLSQWAVLTNVSGLMTNATVRIAPGQYFFYCTASNMWGVSNPSNVASVPPLPRDDSIVSITGVN